MTGFFVTGARSDSLGLVPGKGWMNLSSNSFAVVLCAGVRWLLSITTLICEVAVQAGGNTLRDWVGLAVALSRDLSGKGVKLGAL